MEIYRSAGVATIAALMSIDRPTANRTGPPASDPRDLSRVAAILVRRERAELIFEEGRDISLIRRRCERAVIAAYRDLRAQGTDDLGTFQACMTLYRIHHPDASMREARCLVAAWIDIHLVRGENGLTPACECDA